jgi:hypothetical protein
MSGSIEALRGIMLDGETALRRRILSAELLLGFEAPTEAAEEAKTFLTQVFEDEEVHVDLRLEAAKTMRRAEARKVQVPSADTVVRLNLPDTPEIRAARRRTAQRKACFEREQKLKAMNLWPAPSNWNEDILADSWIAPEPDYGLPASAGLADRVAAARKLYLQGLVEGWARDPEEQPKKRRRKTVDAT